MLSFPKERKGLGHGSGLATGDTATSWTAGRSHRGLSQGQLWKHPGAQHPSSSARQRLCAPPSWEQQGAEQGRKRGTLVSGKGVVITQPDCSPGGEKRLRQQLSPHVAAACKEGVEQSQAGSRAGRREHRGSPLGSAPPQHCRRSRLWLPGMFAEGCSGPRPLPSPHPELQNTLSSSLLLPTVGAGSDVSPVPLSGQSPRLATPSPWGPGCPRTCAESGGSRLTAACRWRVCGSCCWQSRPCGRGWKRRSLAAPPSIWCSAVPSLSRSCTRPWAALCHGSARSALPPPQAPVLQGKRDGEAEGGQRPWSIASTKQQPFPSPGTQAAPEGNQSPFVSTPSRTTGEVAPTADA